MIMNMKKFAIFAAAITLAISCAACSNKDNTDTSNTDKETTAASSAVDDSAADTTADSKTEAPSSEQQAGGPPTVEIKEIPMDDAYLAKILDITDKPNYTIKDSAEESEFIGKWECEVAVNGDTAYTGMLGVPLYASDRIEINEDKTGKVTTTQNGKDGPSTTETNFSWKVADGVLVAEMQGTAGSTYPVSMSMSDDGRLAMLSEDSKGVKMAAYYKSVDAFTDFDFSSVTFSLTALAE